jgi:cytochrome b561
VSDDSVDVADRRCVELLNQAQDTMNNHKETFRRATLGVAALALAAPWIFLGIVEVGATLLWGSSEAARTQATHITRALLYASMLVVPVAASAYGAMASRRRILNGALGGVCGVALWLVSLLCFGAAVASS